MEAKTVGDWCEKKDFGGDGDFEDDTSRCLTLSWVLFVLVVLRCVLFLWQRILMKIRLHIQASNNSWLVA